MRTDFFTRKHKSIRARLFEIADFVGRADWADDDQVKAILARVGEIDDDLRAHGEHEDKYIMPLLKPGAVELWNAMEEDHEEDATRRANLVRIAHGAAATSPEHRVEAGLGFYRAFNRYVSSYLVHLDAEETLVMPTLRAIVPEEELASVLSRFIQEVASKQPPDAAAHIMVHLPPADRAEMLHAMGLRAPPAAFEGLLGRVIGQLTDSERVRLDRDLSSKRNAR